jgi:septum formation protein
MRLILGSQSPRRREILSFFSLPFEQVASHFAEERIPFTGDPIAYASTLSEGKGASLAPHYPKAIILTADTVVFKEGRIFNKPSDEGENLAMLKTLMGSWHSVFTAVTARLGNQKATQCQETHIQFRHLNEEELHLYHQSFKGCDKAGGYSVQMGGNLIIQRMEGCFYNAMGLPLQGLQTVLKEVGIDLWHYLVSC